MAGTHGEYVGRYRLRERLGSGGMGSVWLADDETLGAQVAIKQIEMPSGSEDGAGSGESGGEGSDGSGDLAPIRRARREALHATKLRGHPHVATVLDVVQHEGLPWIVMEYVSGATDLAKVIRDEPRLPDSEICRIGIAVLRALEAGHTHGIVHRDVKPANILLAPDHAGNRHGRVMLTDYGISLEADSGQTRMTQTGVIGTPGYTAPERLRDQERRESDLFSLGATLYCASEGHGPFDRMSAVASFSASLLEPPQAPANAGPELNAVLLGLLDKDPDRRTGTGSAMTGLTRIAGGLPGPGPGHFPGQGQGPGWGQGPGPGWGQGPGYGSGPGSGANWPPAAGSPGAPGAFGAPAPAGAPPANSAYGPTTVGGGADGRAKGNLDLHVVLRMTGRALQKAWDWVRGLSLKGKILLIVAILLLSFTGALLDHWETGRGGSGASGVENPGKSGKDGSDGSKESGGADGGSDHPPADSDGKLPYGKTVGLKTPLRAGDCVNDSWDGKPYKGTPSLKPNTCRPGEEQAEPGGQVLATVSETSRAAAESECKDRTSEVRKTLADPVLYTVVADPRSSQDAESACLLLQRNSPVGGPLGEFREAGDELFNTQLSEGDCIDTRTNSQGGTEETVPYLTSCAEPHNEQVIGHVFAEADDTYDSVDPNELCQEKYRDAWPRPGRSEITGWLSEGEWDTGYRVSTCTLAGKDDSKIPAGKIRALS